MNKKRSTLKEERALDRQDHKPLKIVAIGASAGGLEAVTELLQHITSDTGMVFIYIPHLSPDHKSLLTSILAKVTSIHVQEVTDRVEMEPDNLYIIPPGNEMTVLDGHIGLSARPREAIVHLPIDIFFSSLAETHKENAIGIVLSGSANDGTRGLLAIKAEGGISFAQDDSAKFLSMPQSAIAAGAVDFVLPPKEIATELIKISKLEYENFETSVYTAADIDTSDPHLKTIINLLLTETHIDFSHYKMPAVKRRIVRRMLANKLNSLKEYVEHCVNHIEEIRTLQQDLLISVTNFFRDTNAHEYLRTTLFPGLLKNKKDNEKLRLWIPACATGEEAYSVAITILEIQEQQSVKIPVQIFASDISIKAITKARLGQYNKHELITVSPERLEKYFIKTGSRYTVTRLVRNMCVFAVHDILKNPPFSKIDFISCCNLFIYLDNVAQKKALATFHFALNEDGYLMLGRSETIATSSKLFSPLNNKLKIYARKKKSGNGISTASLPRIQDAKADKPNNIIANTKKINYKNDLEVEIDKLLLANYVPANVVINHAMEILNFRGDSNIYLQHFTGSASLNVLKMTPPEIAFELRHLIPMAIQTNKAIKKTGIEVKSLPILKMINIEVVPLSINWEEPVLLIVFSTPYFIETFLQEGEASTANDKVKDKKIEELENELKAFKADMNGYAQAQETLIEELQSANEEVISNNEEMQSINEELETSKEEIESTNEELTTTNEELQTRNGLLMEAYQYSDALLSNLVEPVLVLDKQLRVLSASKSFYKTFLLTPEETEGLFVYEIGNGEWNIPALRKLLEEMIPQKKLLNNYEVKHVFSRIGEKVMMLNARTIVQETLKEMLILLSIEDHTEKRKAQQVIAESNQRYQAAVSAVLGVVWTKRPAGEMEGEQKGWEFLTGQTYEEYQGFGWTKAIHPDDLKLSMEAWQKAVKNPAHFTFEQRIKLANGEWGYFSKKAVPIFHPDGSVEQWVGVHTDITLQKTAEEKLKQFTKELEQQVNDRTEKLAISNQQLEENNQSLQILNKELQSFSYVASHDLQEPLRKIQSFAYRIIESEDTLSDKNKEYFSRMQKAAERMQTLIEDLLSFSTIQNVKGRKFIKTDLNVIIEEVKNELHEVIEAKEASIITGNLCDVNIIPYQFRQVMINIVGNALKFARSGIAPVINIQSTIVKFSTIKNTTLAPLDEYCQLVISDNGIGFEPEYVEKIFDVFQRLHSKEEYPGTGIGLAIVKKIIDNHNGVIKATSEAGRGATFEIYIPL